MYRPDVLYSPNPVQCLGHVYRAFEEAMLGSGIKGSTIANDRLFASATSRIAPGAYRPLDL
jgi:hypothetical protein